jgi:lysophospholipase L1-like esterase
MGRRIAATLALAAVASGVALLAAELLLRGLRPRAVRIVDYPCIYEEDARFGYRYRPGATGRIGGSYPIHINSLGFHDDEPLPPGASALRVLAVGDSFTASLGTLASQVWTAVLERELREAVDPSADVVNLGIDGTGSDVHRDLLRAYLPRLHPQVVILAFFANDIGDVLHGRFRRQCYQGWVLSYQSDAQRDTLRARVDAHLERRRARWLFQRSYLFRALTSAALGERTPFHWRFLQPSRAELGIDPKTLRSRRPQVHRVFQEIDAIAARCNCRFVVVPVPPRDDLAGSLRAARRAAAGTRLEIVDVLPAMRELLAADGRGPKALHAPDNHLNVYGNRIFGRAIARTLEWSQPSGQAGPRAR